MTKAQRIALDHVALLAEECAHPRHASMTPLGSLVLSVNAGYE
jgi:hypothetical protein